jgi:sugar fermentation stimulation protein A
MRFAAPPLAGRFLRRTKRFFADVELDDGTLVTAHCPNTGSLLGCLEPGARAWLRDSGDERRKLRHTWQAIRIGRTWINVDTSLPNRVVAEAVERGQIEPLAGYDTIQREVRYGENSRVDLLLSARDGRRCWVEVKNTTLAEGTTALFPDAVTERGLKHLRELTRRVRRGERAVQFFFVSRADVEALRAAEAIDPEYARALHRAARAGVEILAWSARVEPRRLVLGRRLRVLL